MLPPPFRAMDPADALAWLAVADWLEEHDQPDRAELVRLTHAAPGPDRPRHAERLTELLAAGVEPCVATVTNGIGMEFAYIPAGTFLMGSPEDEAGRSDDEGPVHEVTITKGVYLGVYAVTQGEYESVMGTNPSHFSATGEGNDKVQGLETSRFPVENVSHDDAVEFCKKLSGLSSEKENNRSYRLPTEAEWEYACRGGAGPSPFHFGKSLSSNQANVDGDHSYGGAVKGLCLPRTCAVGSYWPNGFGLFDMHGNVLESCQDWYDEAYYSEADDKDPQGPQSGTSRVARGGSWCHGPVYCRATYRFRGDPASRGNCLGFRVCFAWTG